MRKTWPFWIIGLISVILGVLAVFTAMKLREEKPIAPSVPQTKPQAIGGNPVPACIVSFTLSLATPSPVPSSTPGTSPSPTPSGTPGPTPTATPGSSPAPTPTPALCNSSCTTNSQCASDQTCYIPSGQSSGNCRNPNCKLATNCSCSCNSPCVSGDQCTSDTNCYVPSGTSGNCRNDSCQTQSNCSCVTPTPTPGSTPAPTTTPKASPITQVPTTGTSWPTLFIMFGGALLLLVGLAI